MHPSPPRNRATVNRQATGKDASPPLVSDTAARFTNTCSPMPRQIGTYPRLVSWIPVPSTAILAPCVPGFELRGHIAGPAGDEDNRLVGYFYLPAQQNVTG